MYNNPNRCPYCNTYTWNTSKPHVCRPSFYVRIVDEKYDWGYEFNKVYADSSGHAAERYVSDWDCPDYDIAGKSDSLKVIVLSEEEYRLLERHDEEVEELKNWEKDEYKSEIEIPQITVDTSKLGTLYKVEGYFVPEYRAVKTNDSTIPR